LSPAYIPTNSYLIDNSCISPLKVDCLTSVVITPAENKQPDYIRHNKNFDKIRMDSKPTVAIRSYKFRRRHVRKRGQLVRNTHQHTYTRFPHSQPTLYIQLNKQKLILGIEHWRDILVINQLNAQILFL